MDEILTVKQVAKELNISPITVWREIQRGRLVAYQSGKKLLRIRRSAVEDYIRRCEIEFKKKIEQPKEKKEEKGLRPGARPRKPGLRVMG